MSTNGQQLTMAITCAGCKANFAVLIPPMDVMNGLYTSAITAPHKNLMRCTRCSEPHVLAITSVQVEWQAFPASPEMVEKIEGSPIIQPLSLVVPR